MLLTLTTFVLYNELPVTLVVGQKKNGHMVFVGKPEGIGLLRKAKRKRKIILKRIFYIYTGCPRRNLPDFGRVFLMLNYTDITQNTYIQS